MNHREGGRDKDRWREGGREGDRQKKTERQTDGGREGERGERNWGGGVTNEKIIPQGLEIIQQSEREQKHGKRQNTWREHKKGTRGCERTKIILRDERHFNELLGQRSSEPIGQAHKAPSPVLPPSATCLLPSGPVKASMQQGDPHTRS